jgi:hypothetical protein
MKQGENQPASVEYVAEMVGKLTVAFYETPEKLFEALIKTILFLKMTESDVCEMVNDAIFTIRKTKITIADVINGHEEKPKKILPYTFD